MYVPLRDPIAPLLEARRYTLEAVAAGWFPGAQVLVAVGEEVVWHEAFGHAALEPEAARMLPETLIDVASLTKALVTSAAALLLCGDGALDLDTPLAALLPESRGTDKARLTVGQLLSHAAGFPLYVPYFRTIVERFTDFRDLPFESLRKEIVSKVLAERLVAAPGHVQQYSDLDFILLGEALGRAAGMELDEFFRLRIAEPLGLTARFSRLTEGPVYGTSFAASEHCPWRGEVLRGAVHDDHAYLMGGVAGHAGLFATASDVFILCREWMRAYHGEGRLFDPRLARLFWTKPSKADMDTWTLGWDTPTPGESTSGVHFSRNTVGHLGFTGASVWLDLERDIAVCLLTNRIHPLRSNLGIKKFRPVFHDVVMEGMLTYAASSR